MEKLLPIESCEQCNELIEGHCYHEKAPRSLRLKCISKIKKAFPDWCPLEDINKAR